MDDATEFFRLSSVSPMDRALAADLYGLLTQRWAFHEKVMTRPTRPSFCTECGQRLVILPWGRPRVTCSKKCRNARYWRNRRQREAAEREAAAA